jgi:hypothetical protein
MKIVIFANFFSLLLRLSMSVKLNIELTPDKKENNRISEVKENDKTSSIDEGKNVSSFNKVINEADGAKAQSKGEDTNKFNFNWKVPKFTWNVPNRIDDLSVQKMMAESNARKLLNKKYPVGNNVTIKEPNDKLSPQNTSSEPTMLRGA